MCGIYGTVSRKGEASAKLALQRAARIAHRGPDGEGSWNSLDHRLALAHRRLAVIDLSEGGKQPMLSSSGRLITTFNGEIYNYREIAQRLERGGYIFRSHSDTEVLLAAYETWGPDCLHHLDGMFAFGIAELDGEGNFKRLFLARDRAGEKPLYYTSYGSDFEFASDPKAFTRPLDIDPDGLNTFMALGYNLPDSCMYAGVKQLEPGHYMYVNAEGFAEPEREYWQLPQGWDGQDRTIDELVDEAWELLVSSVKHQLVSDVPIGAFLSGGLDSSLVVAAAAHTGSQIKTFNVSFPGAGAMDEAAHADLVARHFATDHVQFDGREIQNDANTTLMQSFAEPIADSSILPTYHVSKVSRQFVTVMLGGDGGDELFGGYPQYSEALKYADRLSFVPGFLSRISGNAALRLPMGTRGRAKIGALRWGWDKLRILYSPYFDVRLRETFLTSEFKSRLSQSGIDGPEQKRLALFNQGKTSIEGMTRTDFKTYLPCDILAKVDRASMATSLEVRAPWLNHKLIEFCFSRIPPHLRATANSTRVVQKEMARRYLPKGFEVDRKQGFSLPSSSAVKHFSQILQTNGPNLPGIRPSASAMLQEQAYKNANTGRIAALALYRQALNRGTGGDAAWPN